MYTPAIGGAEQYLRDLLWQLDRSQYDITLFYEPWPPFENFLDLNHCPPVRQCPIPVYEASQFLQNSSQLSKNLKRLRYFFNLLIWQYFWLWPNYRRLQSAFKTTPVDILHINNGGYPGAASARLASLAAKSVGVPACLMTIANTPIDHFWPIGVIERQLDRRVAQAVNCFIVVSNEVGRVLQQKHYFPDEKIKTIYYGIPPVTLTEKPINQASLRQELGLSPTSTVISMVARLSPEKGHKILLEAVAQLRPHLTRQIEVLVIGTGPLLNDLKNYARDLKLEQVVKFTGRLDNQRVRQVLPICDIVTLPSEIEGLPYAITEAMSLSKPVVASRVGGIPEQIIDGETGLLIPPRDPQALAQALGRLIENSELACQMGRQAYHRYQTHFTFERMLQEHEALYQSLS